MDKNELSSYFVEEAKKIKYPVDILNWYRNLYHNEDEDTEQRIMAEAINKVFMELKDKGALGYLNSKKQVITNETFIIGGKINNAKNYTCLVYYV